MSDGPLEDNTSHFSHRFAAEKVGAFAAVIAAISAVIAAMVAGFALYIAHEQLVSGNRAWLAPGDIVVEKPFQPGSGQEIHLTFGNTGRSPALKISRDIKLIPLPRKDIGNRAAIKTAIESATDCMFLKPNVAGFATYPSAQLDSKNRIFVNAADIDKFLAETHYLVVAGCFAYETMDGDHISEFCRFLDFNEGYGPTEWLSTICRYGERAN